eukprot:TRINITY_DN11557_c0_g1_i1.p1 TRINITY_DN11557_c0_g1~~TRINITY_DN11557_c0_g1_i1.p1  ORF type:complete len:220 (+),score=75.30 TRINITY_DN11557_c0_g1_i1:53-712(+)
MGACAPKMSSESNETDFGADNFVPPKSLISSDSSQKAKLFDILHHPQLSLLFHSFLKSNLCDDSLRFFLDVEEYRISPPEIRTRNAAKLLQLYSDPDSASELTFPPHLVRQAKSLLDESPPSQQLFDRLQSFVMVSMVDDSLPSFLEWDLYRQYLTDPITRKVFLNGLRPSQSTAKLATYTWNHTDEIQSEAGATVTSHASHAQHSPRSRRLFEKITAI